MTTLHAVLDRIERAVAADRLPIAVFDLDSTLFDTAGRNLRIVREFAESRGTPSLAAGLGLGDFGWSIAEPLRRRGHEDPALLAELERFWAARFFTDAYVLEDHAAPGAPELVRACYERGAFVYYLTGRHQGGMEAGTLAALMQRGFPVLRGRVALHLKPSFHMNDRAFKDGALREIRSLMGEVVATFENEPGNANMFQHAFPDALHFVYGSVHAPNPEPLHPAIAPISTFRL